MAGCKRSLGAIGGLGLAASLVLLADAEAQTGSFAPQAALETNSLPTGISQPPSELDTGGITPTLREPVSDAPRPKGPVRAGREVRGNPLWGISLTSLNATRERPIFLPSRRAPAPVVAAPPPRPEPLRPPPPAEPERPRLALVGAVVGEVEAVAIFVDQGTRGIVRLRTGEHYSGWVLRSVKGREATLEKGREMVLLALPAPGEQGRLQADPQPIPPALPGAPVLGVPTPSPMGAPVAPTVRGPAPPPAPRPNAPRPPRGPSPPPAVPPA